MGIFDQSIIFFDTSALLDFYFYSDESRNVFITKILERLRGELWITNQVFFEFNKQKETVNKKPLELYKKLSVTYKDKGFSSHLSVIDNEIKSQLKKSLDTIESHLKTFGEQTKRNDKHPYLDQTKLIFFQKAIEDFRLAVNKLGNDFQEFSGEIEKQIENCIAEIKDKVANDQIGQVLMEKFQIGEEWQYSKLVEIVKEGKMRYENKIPPGYLDNDKIGFQKYGDLIMWKQILEIVSNEKRSVILVINDMKEDWWSKEKGKKPEPRYELVKEIKEQCSSRFTMLTSADFLYKFKNELGLNVSDETISNIKDVVEKKWRDSADDLVYMFLSETHGDSNIDPLDSFDQIEESKHYDYAVYDPIKDKHWGIYIITNVQPLTRLNTNLIAFIEKVDFLVDKFPVKRFQIIIYIDNLIDFIAAKTILERILENKYIPIDLEKLQVVMISKGANGYEILYDTRKRFSDGG